MIQALALIAAALVSPKAQTTEQLHDYCPLYWVFFDEGSARLNRPGRAIVESWAAFSRRFEAPQNRYTIEVVNDGTGSHLDNLDLSYRRGRTIVRHLVSMGLRADRFRVRVLGDSDAPWHEERLTPAQNRAGNRRATLILETTPSNFTRVMGNLVC